MANGVTQPACRFRKLSAISIGVVNQEAPLLLLLLLLPAAAAGASKLGAGLFMASSKKPSGKWPSSGPWPRFINTPLSGPLYWDM
jgi:hypothetical protein